MSLPPHHVLVVDDDEAILEILRYVLEDAGYQVSVACDGATAMAIAREGDVALVLLDVTMPEMPGTEVGRLLRADARTSEIRIVMHTGLSESEVRAEFAGYDDFAQKLAGSPDELKKVVAAALVPL